jgi:hypothetical protein
VSETLEITDAHIASIREIIEWDWLYTDNNRSGGRLHHAASLEDPAWWYIALSGKAVMTCGLRGAFRIPGIISRMNMPRCARCCDRLGISRGDGSPKNDEALRSWVRARLEDGNGE